MRHFFMVFAGAVVLAVCSAPVQATTVLYDNLGAPLGNGSLGTLAPFRPAASFSTGSTPITLTDVQLNLATGVVVDPLVTVYLLSDSGTAPGSLLDVLDSGLSVSGSPTVYDLGPLSVLLAASTRYWIAVLGGCLFCSPIAYWSVAANDSGTGVRSEYSSQFNDAGVSNSLTDPFVMEVSGVAVPEPPVLPFFASGFLAMVFLGRRRLRFPH